MVQPVMGQNLVRKIFGIRLSSACRSFLCVHFSGTYPTALTSQAAVQAFSVCWTHLTAVRYLQGLLS